MTTTGVYTAQDAFEFVAYFAMTAALAEFAIGNRERAIQLLDDFLTKGSPYDGDRNRGFAASEKVSKAAQLCGNVQDESKKKSCEVHSERLSRARHLIVRARLETLEDNIIDDSDNPGLTAIRISLLNRALRDMDSAPEMFAAETGFEEQALFGAHVGASGSHCELRNPAGPEDKARIALWLAAATTLRANALLAASVRPYVASVKPYLVPILDAYAGKARRIRRRLCSRILPTKFAAGLRSNLLASAAAYWKTKGERFGIEASDASRLSQLGLEADAQITALCNAPGIFNSRMKSIRRNPKTAPSTKTRSTWTRAVTPMLCQRKESPNVRIRAQ